MTGNSDYLLVQSVAAFLFKEARLMDANQYPQWLEMFDSECTYWIPSNQDDFDPNRHVSILYCDRPMLENHVRRLTEGKAFAQSPKSRLLRSVTNVEASRTDRTITAHANFHIMEIRAHRKYSHGGRAEYQLREQDSGFLIQHKKVLLLDIDEPQDSISFLI